MSTTDRPKIELVVSANVGLYRPRRYQDIFFDGTGFTSTLVLPTGSPIKLGQLIRRALFTEAYSESGQDNLYIRFFGDSVAINESGGADWGFWGDIPIHMLYGFPGPTGNKLTISEGSLIWGFIDKQCTHRHPHTKRAGQEWDTNLFNRDMSKPHTFKDIVNAYGRLR